MLSNEQYIKKSLDLNLFFLRIMKEHALFLAVAFPPKNEKLIQEAKNFNQTFNDLLLKAIDLSQGIININNDAITEYTIQSEKKTTYLTGFPIDTNLSELEISLTERRIYNQDDNYLIDSIRNLNDKSIVATRNIIRYKTKLLDEILTCQLYATVYPLLIDHIRREALLFVDSLTRLQNKEESDDIEANLEQEIFWNKIMAEHSQFIRGFLDPTEEALIELANNFSIRFNNINKKTINVIKSPHLFEQITNESLLLTKEINGFKIQGTEGILSCSIKSLIVPLLGDHVIRESNHFLHILKSIKEE